MKQLSNGFKVLGSSLKFIVKHPLILFPFFVCWGIYAFLAIYVTNNINFDGYETWQLIIIVWLFSVLYSLVVSISSLILLEMLEQLESTGKMNILIAVKDMLLRDLVRTIPVIIVWSFFQLFIFLMKVLASALKDKKGRSTYLSRIVNRWLNRIEKGVRLQVMLMLPAIAWDEYPAGLAFSNAKYIYLKYFGTMMTGYIGSEVINLLLVIPLYFYISLTGGVEFGSANWYIVIGYIVFTWSFSKMLEQLFCGELYLWFRKFDQAKLLAKKNGTKVPEDILDIPKPSLSDNILDM